jgi:signal transduction histidine kinase/ActR/RegA family two-component response regulator
MRLPQWALRKMRWSLPVLTTKGALAVAVWGIAIVSIVAALLVQDAYQSAARRADTAAVSLAATVEQDIRRNLELLDLSLQAAAGGLEIPAIQDPATQTRNRLLFERTPRDQYVDFVEALNEKGDVIAGSPPPQYGENWARRDYFSAVRTGQLTGPYIGRPFSTAYGDNAAISISRRLTDQDGNFAGVVVMGMRLAYFRDLLVRLGLGPNDSAMVLRDDGTILVRLPFDRNQIGDTLNAAAPFYAFMRNGLTPVTAVDPIDGVERRFAFRHVGTLPVVVSIGLSNDAIRTEALAQLWPLVPGLGAPAVLLVILAGRLSRERRQREAAERESREKSRFLTMLSHELRTPLHGVLGYADQLARDATLGAAQSRQVAGIVRAARHMRDVVNVVLDYARIEALGPTLHMRRIDVRNLVEDCLAVIEPGAKARGLETRFAVAVDAPTHFVTDDVQLRQILVNVLSNAVKYTPRGTVELKLGGNEEHLTIEVADTGIGIPAGQRHLLFREYERFGTERTSIEGTGLGLAIAHRLVRRMGGHIGHRDNPCGGSVFWLELPAGVADEKETLFDVAELGPERRLKVLVVDDSEINREVAAAFLRKAGHSVTEAHDGFEAVRLAAEQDFDVVLMDMRMAGLDGLEATRRIRALDGPRATVPIVAVTANALDQHAEECRRAGMSAHLAKPFTQAELLTVVQRAAASRPHASPPAIDPINMTDLVTCMGPDAVTGLLDCLALRIEAVLRKLDEPASFVASEALCELTHELVGSAGTLGFTELASVARRFQEAIATSPAEARRMVAPLRCAAEDVLAELQRQRAAEGMAPA